MCYVFEGKNIIEKMFIEITQVENVTQQIHIIRGKVEQRRVLRFKDYNLTADSRFSQHCLTAGKAMESTEQRVEVWPTVNRRK